MKAKKRWTVLLCVVLSLACALLMTACGKDKDDENPPAGDVRVPTEGLEYTLSDDGAYYICSGIGSATATDITIAAQYDGKPVKAIGESAFEKNGALTSVKISDGVTSIGSYAFEGCPGMTISFGGTKAQWAAIRKESYWNKEVGYITVNCSDGKVVEI